MKILLSPQVPLRNNKIYYDFTRDKIEITMKIGEEYFSDFIDFSEVPDGKLVEVEDIDGELPLNPILDAEQVDGELFVTLLNWINLEAHHEEMFPEWVDSSDYGEYLKRVTPSGDYFNLKGHTPVIGDGIVGLMVIPPTPSDNKEEETTDG